MGRARKKQDKRGPLQRSLDNERVANDQSYLDVITPEMAAKGCYNAESKGRRYFRTQHLDRLHRAGKLTYEQYEAGKMYRDLYEAGRYDSTRTADWTRVRGENVVTFTLPTSAQDSRDRWRDARKEVPIKLVGFLDRLVLRDDWPQSRQQRDRASYLTTLRNGLDVLVYHFRLA